MIRDQIIYENKMSFLQTKCISCSSKQHISTNCPLIHYIPDRIKIVRRYNRDPGHKQRTLFDRKRTKKFNSILYLKYVQSRNNYFRRNCKFLFDFDDQESYNDMSPGLLKVLRNNRRFDAIPNNGEIEKQSKRHLIINTRFDEKSISTMKSLKSLENFERLKEKNNLSSNIKITESKVFDNNHIEEESQFFKMPKLSEFIDSEDLKDELGTQSIIKRKNTRADTLAYYDLDPLKTEVDPMLLTPLDKSRKFEENLKINEMQKNCLFLGHSKSIQEANSNKSQIEVENNMNTDKFNNNMNNEDDVYKFFEKGANFRNYYPFGNLINVLKIQKHKRNQKRELVFENFFKSNPKRHSLKKKVNKVFPGHEYEKANFTMLNMENLKSKPKRRDSNIFKNKSETNFGTQTVKKFTFYDVVSEVLQNQSLRKKLQMMKLKKKTII